MHIMKNQFTKYTLLTMLSMLVFVVSCNEDEAMPKVPVVSGPSAITSVQASNEASLTFNVTTDGGYKAATASSLSGAATSITSEPAIDAKSGTVVVKYIAGATAVADQVNLTVSDNSTQTAVGSATIQVTVLPPPPANVVLAGIITKDTVLTADRIWELSGRVIIDEGKKITIQAGTIVKGREGQASSASALIISRGAKIEANGTAANPVIFTSILDNIKVGEKAGTNLTKTDNSKWGGLIILGKAPISAGDGDTEATIEGLPADEPYAQYGGNVDDDNSGFLKYVSIRHGGTLIGEGNEINGLTLGGVGSGTVIENVEVFATLDDGIELFGGTVNVKNFISTWQGDDGVDIDQNYSGTVENFAVVHGDLVGTDEGLEIDGPEGTTNVNGLFFLKNGTCMTDSIAGTAADFKSKAQGTVENVVFKKYKGGAQIKIAASYQNDCVDAKTDAFTHLTQAIPTLIFTNSKFDSNKVYTSSKASDGTTTCTVPDADQTAADDKLVSDADATGADLSVFVWTLTNSEGLIP
jgi:hypothetical protein